jgi:hypothetical protein
MTRGSTQTKPGDKLYVELDRWAEEADRVIHEHTLARNLDAKIEAGAEGIGMGTP